MKDSSLFDFIKLLTINIAFSMIGPLVFLGPIFGFIMIVIYSILLLTFRKNKLLNNLILSLLIILPFVLFAPDLILIGMLFQSIGIILGVVLSSLFVTRIARKENELRKESYP